MSYYTWKDQEAGEAKACYGPKEGKDQCSATQISGCLPTAAPTVAPTAAPTATPTYACVSELPEVSASPPSPSLPLGSPGVPAGPILPENRLLGFAGPDGGQWCYQQASSNQPDLCSTYYLELGPEDVVGAEGYVPCSAGCDRCEITLKNDVPACRNDRDDGVFTICPTAAPTLAPTVAPTTAAPTVAPTALPTTCTEGLASRSVLTGGDVCKDADINDCESFYWVKNAAKGKYKLCYTEPDESKCKGEDIVCELTAAPTLAPTVAPTLAPSSSPSSAPSSSPSSAPSSAPTVAPTAAPSYACVDSPDPAYYLMGEAGSDGDQWCYQKASGFVGNLDECTNYYVEIGDKAVVEAPGYIACSAGCEYCSVLPKPTNPSMEVCRQASQPSDPDPFIFTICPE